MIIAGEFSKQSWKIYFIFHITTLKTTPVVNSQFHLFLCYSLRSILMYSTFINLDKIKYINMTKLSTKIKYINMTKLSTLIWIEGNMRLLQSTSNADRML